jgi:hypothetical protein
MQTGADPETNSAGSPATDAVEVVMTNHGRFWTGVRFEWTERLRLGYPGIM